jgi:hypothetical protein
VLNVILMVKVIPVMMLIVLVMLVMLLIVSEVTSEKVTQWQAPRLQSPPTGTGRRLMVLMVSIVFTVLILF